jgi:hypothetical protein
MADTTPFQRARARFNVYAGMDKPVLPTNEMSAAQVLLARWVNEKVKHSLPNSVENVLGITEEMGELEEVREEMLYRKALQGVGKLAHYELNVSQKRRYSKLSEEELRALEADCVADIGIFLMNFCTSRRLDFGALLLGTAEQVTRRDWLAFPEDAHARK